jgi:hypothetical protein
MLCRNSEKQVARSSVLGVTYRLNPSTRGDCNGRLGSPRRDSRDHGGRLGDAVHHTVRTPSIELLRSDTGRRIVTRGVLGVDRALGRGHRAGSHRAAKISGHDE